ncbi:MAG: hypothetical protein WCB02_28615 [Bradyrhizobium sp.]
MKLVVSKHGSVAVAAKSVQPALGEAGAGRCPAGIDPVCLGHMTPLALGSGENWKHPARLNALRLRRGRLGICSGKTADRPAIHSFRFDRRAAKAARLRPGNGSRSRTAIAGNQQA